MPTTSQLAFHSLNVGDMVKSAISIGKGLANGIQGVQYTLDSMRGKNPTVPDWSLQKRPKPVGPIPGSPGVPPTNRHPNGSLYLRPEAVRAKWEADEKIRRSSPIAAGAATGFQAQMGAPAPQ